jgi:hypothetical protein
MTVEAILSLLLGPTSIAVHNDGDVSGQPLQIDLLLGCHMLK